MQYIKIFLLAILFLSCQKETPRLEVKAKDYASYLKGKDEKQIVEVKEVKKTETPPKADDGAGHS